MRYLTLLLLFTASLFAADFKVESFDRADGDLTAIQANVKDVNDELCGQIRIFTEFTDLVFESSPSPMEVKKMTGEIRVFFTPGSKFIMLRKEGYKALRFVFPQKIEGGVSYRLNLGTTGAKLEDITVNIITTPPGATIFIDNIDKGTDKQQKVSVGNHELRLVKSGYETTLAKVAVSASQTMFEYTLKEVDPVSVLISSTPNEAEIILDNQSKGNTDKGLFLFPGSYQLELKKNGYLPSKAQIEVKASGENKFNYKLTKNSSSLKLTVTPTNARILINKEDYSSQSNIELSPGTYKIEISKAGYKSSSETVELKLGEPLIKSYKLEAIVGKLQVSVTPADAEISLVGAQNQNWVGAKIVKGLPVGDYTITAKSAGFKSQSKSITVSESQTAEVDLALVKAVTQTVSNPVVQTQSNSSDAPDNMVFVQGGTFQMGSNERDDEKPIHSVTVSDFYIGKYEVTQKEWQAVMGSNPSRKYNGIGDNNPVNMVSWDDCQEFIRKLNAKTGKKYRLPTEAEWEYAARGGNKSNGYEYSGSNDLGSVGWYKDNSSDKTHPVGTKQANELGIYDMSGNVWEWCSGRYGSYSSGSQTNPTDATTGSSRVLRGGSYGESGGCCRVAYRLSILPYGRHNVYGFRLARTY